MGTMETMETEETGRGVLPFFCTLPVKWENGILFNKKLLVIWLMTGKASL